MPANGGQSKCKRGEDASRRACLLCSAIPVEVDMKIGVSGASGHLGRAVVSELLQRAGGHEVVAITRTPETVSGPARGRFGDYNGPKALRRPMRVSIVCSRSEERRVGKGGRS